ncbi:MAG: 30S ribosomal protein S12 methylthiotransferase RimO [Coriobacteriia bacterium]|nr:30S ribosomal protein S12 methylthiotransferase RimO [Coriobacteriia bacterium]
MANTTTHAPSVAFVTLGCAKNEVDSQEMSAKLVRAGYLLADDPEQADVIIINTCSFIQAATEESIDTFFELAGLDRVAAGESKIVMAGCLPARYGADLEEELTEAQAFVPCSREDDIVQIVAGLIPDFVPEAPVLTEEGTIGANEYALTTVGDNPWTAYVKISDGCDRMCAYCTIPFIRGHYHSFTLEEIERDVDYKVASGVREITLIAQDTGRWGQDFAERSSLARLMDHLATQFPEIWFRVMYIQPEGVTDELLQVMRAHENICSYLDIPFQHAAKRVLRAMNRRGCGDDFRNLISHIRDEVPDVTLRTTLIAGFPGETEEEFEELLDFVSEAELDYVGVFPYSREDGTRAAELEGQIDEETKQERAQAVRDLADSVSAGVIAARTGKTMPVLIIGTEEDGQLYGRAKCQAPDVDGVTFVYRGAPGEIINTEIAGTLMYEMEGD